MALERGRIIKRQKSVIATRSDKLTYYLFTIKIHDRCKIERPSQEQIRSDNGTVQVKGRHYLSRLSPFRLSIGPGEIVWRIERVRKGTRQRKRERKNSALLSPLDSIAAKKRID